jgi:hypothetical protein
MNAATPPAACARDTLRRWRDDPRAMLYRIETKLDQKADKK